MKRRRDGSSRHSDQLTGHDSKSLRCSTSQRGDAFSTIKRACAVGGAVNTSNRAAKSSVAEAEMNESTAPLSTRPVAYALVWIAHSPPPAASVCSATRSMPMSAPYPRASRSGHSAQRHTRAKRCGPYTSGWRWNARSISRSNAVPRTCGDSYRSVSIARRSTPPSSAYSDALIGGSKVACKRSAFVEQYRCCALPGQRRRTTSGYRGRFGEPSAAAALRGGSLSIGVPRRLWLAVQALRAQAKIGFGDVRCDLVRGDAVECFGKFGAVVREHHRPKIFRIAHGNRSSRFITDDSNDFASQTAV